jgi:hypothetical protein
MSSRISKLFCLVEIPGGPHRHLEMPDSFQECGHPPPAALSPASQIQSSRSIKSQFNRGIWLGCDPPLINSMPPDFLLLYPKATCLNIALSIPIPNHVASLDDSNAIMRRSVGEHSCAEVATLFSSIPSSRPHSIQEAFTALRKEQSIHNSAELATCQPFFRKLLQLFNNLKGRIEVIS